MAERFQDFCLNEESRVRRMAKALEEAGMVADAQELRAVADMLLGLAQRRPA